MRILKTLVLSACFGWPAFGFAQHYELAGVKAGRYEVTNKLDAHPDSDALRIVAPYRHAVDSIMSPVLGESEVAMSAGRPESLLSNFVADVLRESSVRIGKKADIGLCNIGGLRSNMPKGKVTYGDVLEIAPFENCFCVLALDGRKLAKLMEQIAAVGGEGISGANLVITSDGRLLSAKVGGNPIDPKRIYLIATLDYLSEGNDRMYALKDHLSIKNTKITVRDLIMEYIRRQHEQGKKITEKIEGRIVKQ
ncbi:MAG: 5'-nucleotidase C-terminal domain-containing protein [Paraprevotella sp.]|nr:5'-nucleotidase C-terminal domain-containing protein [Paraprevotella sp.]